MKAITALGEPTRQRIIEILADGELSAGEIVDRFDMSASAISQHLKVLREAKLIRARVDGQNRIYDLDPTGLAEVAEWLNRVRRFWANRLDAFESSLQNSDDNKGRYKDE